jgi:hypothetical protein
MFIHSSIYKIPCMPSISLDQQPTKNWVIKESRNGGQINRTSKWNWPVQQSPPVGAWKHWINALQGIASEDGDLCSSLGSWKAKRHTHQTTEWNLDATTLSLFRYYEGVWTNHRAINYGRPRFELKGTATEEPRRITQKAEGVQRRRQIDLIEVYAVTEGAPERGNDPAESIYTSEMGGAFVRYPNTFENKWAKFHSLTCQRTLTA